MSKNEPRVLENRFYKRSVLLFLSTGTTQHFFISRKSKWFSMQFAFFSSLIANMATIWINFQQKSALVRNFQHFAVKFLNQKRFLARLKSALILFKLARKMWRFLLELLSAIARSYLARKNDVTDFARL